MTIAGVGKVIPAQMYLMQLAGLVISGRRRVIDPTEVQVSASKEEAYNRLKKLTGEDFGYDVEQWYKHLVLHHGAAHSYGYSSMRQFLNKQGYKTPWKKELENNEGER